MRVTATRLRLALRCRFKYRTVGASASVTLLSSSSSLLLLLSWPSLLGDTCLGVWVGCASDTASTYAALHCQLPPAPRVSETQCVLIDGLLIPPPRPRFAAKLSSLPCIVCPGFSPSAAAARFILASVRSGLRASIHSGNAFPSVPRSALHQRAANAGWRAITGLRGRRVPSAS